MTRASVAVVDRMRFEIVRLDDPASARASLNVLEMLVSSILRFEDFLSERLRALP